MRSFEIIVALCLATISASPDAQADDVRARHAPPFTPAWAAPQLDIFPEGGPPGTRVAINGAKFHRGVGVFLGDQPMPIIELGSNYIVAMIPRSARGGDYIYVVDNTGRARTVVPFDVIRRSDRDARYDHYHYKDRGYRR